MFLIREKEKLGIERAAQWHEHMAGIFREAVETRRKYGIGMGELMWKLDEHEGHAQSLRQLQTREEVLKSILPPPRQKVKKK